MHARIRRTTAVDAGLIQAREQLQVDYARYHNTAPFWSAYQAIQDRLTDAYPQHRLHICNQMAGLAERLGVVARAQLLGRPPPAAFRDAGHTESTSP
ncbi:hypothetical protein [Stenotrophomonas rhizophila]|uniref:hypothetical protein n=1 Tax=Stenotrophomonas rhizophila TaxID=216778 RepID=UPI001E4A6FCC|nr:hypothetical protein [Stenotrophomonas rhizophila]MCC7633716.1 hypothetical protein [Stenotrophomonas rhizophila]MCC7663662.1 hypothetical protein [Stenotrophomonas rhizophila]